MAIKAAERTVRSSTNSCHRFPKITHPTPSTLVDHHMCLPRSCPVRRRKGGNAILQLAREHGLVVEVTDPLFPENTATWKGGKASSGTNSPLLSTAMASGAASASSNAMALTSKLGAKVMGGGGGGGGAAAHTKKKRPRPEGVDGGAGSVPGVLFQQSMAKLLAGAGGGGIKRTAALAGGSNGAGGVGLQEEEEEEAGREQATSAKKLKVS